MARQGLMDDSGYDFFDASDCANYESCREEAYKDGYEKGRAEVVDKIENLRIQYVDACNMCTKMECDVCAINNFIEHLEQLKEQNNGKSNEM